MFNANPLPRRRLLWASGATLAALGLIGGAGIGGALAARDDDDERDDRRTPATRARIVLVHGAFADGTGWQRVIPPLLRRGYAVIAAQIPLTSLATDVETARRVLDAEARLGPVVAVGHSYGGAVITGAAAGNPNVKALVYVAAFAPLPGEPVAAFLDRYPTPLGTAQLVDSAGFVTVDRTKFRDVFARDVDPTEASVAAAAQKPIAGAAFGQAVDAAAWQSVPSWYLLTTEDRAIHPDLERFYARRIGATTVEVASSHAVFVSHPQEVVRLIEAAARATT